MNIVIIGGVAAGAKAAAKARRLLPDAKIDIYTEDTHVSYSSCGLPYYVQGNFNDYKKLIVRTPEEFAQQNVDVHLLNRVIKIIPKIQKILVKDLTNDVEFPVVYDKLVIATGAKPYIPDIKNVNMPNVYKVRTLEDGIAIKEAMQNARHITIVGGGYIGIEMLESFVKNNIQTTLIEASSHVLSMLDSDIAELIIEYINEESNDYAKLLTNDTVVSFEGKDKVEEVITANGERFATDMVIMCAGIRPTVDIAVEAGIKLGKTGAIKVNSRMETNIENIYACGDCIEETNVITHRQVWLPLGTNANKEGRCAAVNLAGYTEDFEGVLGSTVTRYLNLTISTTGLTHKVAEEEGFDPVSIVVTKRDKAGYMPEVRNVTIKLTADKRTHKLLGGQAIGCGDADKRINTLSVGLLNGITVEEFLGADITYAPPFSTTIDPLLSATRLLIDKLR